MKNCIHYIACDTIKYCREAEASAANLRQNCSNSYIILYTNCSFNSKAFDDVIRIRNLIPGGFTSKDWTEGRLYFENKIKILSDSPFERNLYLDGDVKTLVNIDCIFDMLDKFGFVLAHDSCRSSKWSDELNIPLAFPDMNLGILFFNKTKTKEFFQKWLENYELYPQPHDQPSFRKTLWDSNVRFAILPPEFNIRPKQFHYRQDPAIIHGRGQGFLPEIKDYEGLFL